MESKLEKVLLTLYKEEIIAFIKAYPEYFEEVIELAVSDVKGYHGVLPDWYGAAWRKMTQGLKNILTELLTQ